MTTKTITPLRQRMIEDMNARNLSEGTQRGHIRACKRFAAFLKRSPDTAEADDVRRFQLHLMEDGASLQTRNRTMTGVRFLFRVTLRRHDLAAEVYHIKEPFNLPLTLSQEEARRLLTCASSVRLRLMLALAYGCGLRAGEVARLKTGDVDSAQSIIRVVAIPVPAYSNMPRNRSSLSRSLSCACRLSTISALRMRLGSAAPITIDTSVSASLMLERFKGLSAVASHMAIPARTKATVAVSRCPRRSPAQTSGTITRQPKGALLAVTPASGVNAIRPTAKAAASSIAVVPSSLRLREVGSVAPFIRRPLHHTLAHEML
jgi:Phage integrase, N-terminal SAM-like domain/Phage integrase family